MDSPNSPKSLSTNRIQATQELIKGKKLINNLYEMLGRTQKIDTYPKTEDSAVIQILEMFENTLKIISSNKPQGHLMSDIQCSCSSDGKKLKKVDESLGVIPVKSKRGCYKRRKNSSSSTIMASVLVDDGHAWRKYGQKHIFNYKHQRSYYRCTNKFDQGCLATKHVQKIMDKPSNYQTTYFGQHTCNNLQRPPPIILDSMNPIDTSILLSFETNDFTEKKQNDPSFLPIKHEIKEGLPSIGDFKHNMCLSSDKHFSWDPNTCAEHVSLEQESLTPTKLDDGHMIPSGAHLGSDHGDMIFDSPTTSTYWYDMDHMFGRNDLNDFPFELCF